MALKAAQALEPREVDFLRHFQALSKRFQTDLAQAALETAILRQEAERKFPSARQMYFTRPALEQASSFPVSTYRAGRYKAFERVLDLGCSIGGDSLALARVLPVVGVDLDPLRLALAAENLKNVRLPASFVLADLAAELSFLPSENTALFFDPARRSQGRRIFSVREYQPPLEIIRNWLPGFPALGVKISPGVNLDEIRQYDAEVEFISLDGELKEAVLWFGPLREQVSGPAVRRATLLPGPHTLASSDPVDMTALPLDEPREVIYEPDPAVLRAGLVSALGEQLQAAQLDADIAYLTAHSHTSTPFARSWKVESWMPFNLKRLRAALRERQVGQVTVKKRGSPLQPEDLIRELRLPSPEKAPERRVIFLTHLRGKPIVVLAMENEPPNNP